MAPEAPRPTAPGDLGPVNNQEGRLGAGGGHPAPADSEGETPQPQLTPSSHGCDIPPGGAWLSRTADLEKVSESRCSLLPVAQS